MGEREFTSASFYQFLGEHRLMASRCQLCGALYLPPRPLCPACHGEDMEWVEMGGSGSLLAFTVIYIAPSAMIEAGYGKDNPYCAGIVRLTEGPAISAQVLGVDVRQPAQIAIGTQLKVAFVERGEGDKCRTCLAFTIDGA
jgi:uncharacterized OB-fold protein